MTAVFFPLHDSGNLPDRLAHKTEVEDLARRDFLARAAQALLGKRDGAFHPGFFGGAIGRQAA